MKKKTERTTVVFDVKYSTLVRLMQAQKIKNTNKNVSFSEIVNQILKEHFKLK